MFRSFLDHHQGAMFPLAEVIYYKNNYKLRLITSILTNSCTYINSK